MENLVVYNNMTYINKRLLELDDLKKEYDRLGEKEFIRIYSKYEGFMGSQESIEFIKQVFSKEIKSK